MKISHIPSDWYAGSDKNKKPSDDNSQNIILL